MSIFLKTERLLLRRFTQNDVGNLVDLDGDSEVMRFINGGKPTTREEIENKVLPAFFSYYDRYEGYGFWAAIERSTGEFLGWFHFRPEEGAGPDEPELGYRLHRSAWGQGYATEGSRALIRKGFTELGVERVVASTMAVNNGSRSVMEKGGPEIREVLPSRLAGRYRGFGRGRRRVRADQGRVGAAEPRRTMNSVSVVGPGDARRSARTSRGFRIPPSNTSGDFGSWSRPGRATSSAHNV